MLFIPSPLHSRCCNIKDLLYEINCYIAAQAMAELDEVRYRVGSGASKDLKDVLFYKDILMSWANGNHSYDTTFSSIVSNIKRLITK